MNGTKDWFCEQTRSKRKEMLHALHLARRLLMRSGNVNELENLKELLSNLEAQHESKRVV